MSDLHKVQLTNIMKFQGERMQIQGDGASLKEAKLVNELRRIRNTYSFQLGLLITESFFRKPWKILYFPLSFLAMNWNYLRNKRNQNNNLFLSDSMGLNPQTALLFVSSEGGKAACERAENIASQWLQDFGNHLIIVSSNKGLTGLNKNNLSLYMIPDPKSEMGISVSQWNGLCENVVSRAIYTHLPSFFVFDGPYPYRGVLNAIESTEGMRSVWIQSERTDTSVIEKVKSSFSVMTRMDNQGMAELKGIGEKRTYHSLTNKLLFATGYGLHEDLQKPSTKILKALSDYNNLHLISIKGPVSEQNPLLFQEVWDNVIENPSLPKLQGAIVSDNVELIAKLHSLKVPTLCVTNNKTTEKTKKYIQSLAKSGGLFVTNEFEQDEIILYIEAILNREWNLSITQKKSVQISTNWFNKLLDDTVKTNIEKS